MRNIRLLKTWLLGCLSLMAVNVMAQLRPDTPADYGCASIGTVYWDESEGKMSVKGWTRTDDGMFLSDEFDLSQIENPAVIVLDKYYHNPVHLKKLLVSEDGVTFNEYTAMKSGLNPIPKTAKRVKIQAEDPSAVQFLLVGEMWNREISKNYSKELDYRIITGTDSLDSHNRHIYKSVPVNGDYHHHQMEFTAKVNPVLLDGEVKESFLEHAVVDIHLEPFNCYLEIENECSEGYYEGDVSVTITFMCDGKVIQSNTQTRNRIKAYDLMETSGSYYESSLSVLVPRNATDINVKLEWNTNCSDLFDEYDELNWTLKYVTTNPTPMLFSVSEVHEFANETSSLELSTIPDHWFDYDGDGIKECKDYKFKADMLSQYPIINGLKGLDGWINYGHDERTDAYSTRYIYKIEDNKAQEVLTIPDDSDNRYVTFRPLDFNNDGTPDFWKGKQYDVTATKGEALTLGPDGTFVSENISLMTAEEYYNLVEESGGGHKLDFGFGSVSGSSKPTTGANGSSYAQIDLNNDGYPDYIDYPSGYYLLNTGDGRFVIDTFGGTVAMRDFDGDGICDMFLYDAKDKQLTVYLQRSGGEPVTQKLFSGLYCSQVWIRDFDKDGDLDILAAFNTYDNEYLNPDSETYLLVFENNGNGGFKCHENFIEGKINFIACTDYDADGEYEVIGWTESEEGRYDKDLGWVHDFSIWSCSMTGIKIDTKCVLLDVYPYWINSGHSADQLPDVTPANVDNSGLTRLVFRNKMLTPSEAKNSRPTRPSAPKVSYDASTGEVHVTWERGNDKETAQLDLTYELRIGTAPDKGDIMYAYAKADGSRLNMLEGNCGFQTHRRLDAKGWPEGTIYVSVQAIDDGKMGSEFSPCTTFQKKEPAGAFTITNVEGATVGDEFVLTLTRPKVAGSTYTWDLGDGVIKSDQGNSWTVTYPTAGKKELTLSVVSATGNRSTITRTVNVAGMRAERVEALGWSRINAAVDIDLDGKTEVLTDKFFEGDEAGNYTTVKRMFNNQLDWSRNDDCYVVDHNMDGLPDFIGFYWLMNQGDKSMEIQESQVNDSYRGLTADFDNDGFVDYLTDEYVIEKNDGDYKTFTPEVTIHGARWTADFNGDGLIDLLCNNNEVLLNQGDFTFQKDETFSTNGLPTEDHEYAFCFNDFDGDGKLDIAWTGAYPVFQGFSHSDKLTVRWGDGTSVVIPVPSGYLFGFVKRNALDIDNNGCMDLYVNTDKNVGFIVYFNSDRSYRIEKDEMLFESNMLAYRRTDGLLGIDCFKVFGSANQAPTAPTQLRTSQDDKFVTIEWNAGTDTETAPEALRYNISIKQKGAEGEGTYFLSPLNGGVNGAAVPSGKQLLRTPKICIPVESIPAGEYEVKVQSVDMQWAQSDFSEPIYFTVVATGAFDLPHATMVGKLETIGLHAGINASDIDFGEGAEIVAIKRRYVVVRWLTEGTKTVTCGEYSGTIHVHPALDASFTLPDMVYTGTKLRIRCDNTHNSKWELVKFRYYDNPEFFDVVPIPQDDEFQLHVIDDHTVEFIFAGKSWETNFALRHTLTEDYGSDTCQVKPDYYQMSETPEVHLVDIDPSNHYRVSWNVPSQLAPLVTGVNIFRETSTLGRYEQIGSIGTDANSYVDEQSKPAEKSERYAISYVLSYGETQMTEPHTPVHLMINRGAYDTGWDLCWNCYEGHDVNNYRILRGTSPENMECIESFGRENRYNDLTPPGGTLYYAVEFLPDNFKESATSTWIRSNVVCTDNLTGIEDVDQENSAQCPSDVYTLQGVLIKRDTKDADIRKLAPGLYIIGGRKVMIK